MAESDYKYDVGISFLQRDEPLARELSDILSKNLDVFVYSEQQEQLAGTEGLETFRSAFRTESRANVVLYRDGWGETPWTRVEKTAIQDRCLNEGWGTLIFVNIDSDSSVPVWIPETKIRFSLPDYSMMELAGAIKARVEEQGGTLKKQDALTRARTLQHQTDFRRKRELLMRSHAGVQAVSAEVHVLFNEVCRLVSEINDKFEAGISAGYTENTCTLTNGRVSLRLHWCPAYENSVEKSRLVVNEVNGRLILPLERGRIIIREPGIYQKHKFDPDLHPNMEWHWKGNNRQAYSSNELADHCVQILLKLIDKADKGEIRVHDPF